MDVSAAVCSFLCETLGRRLLQQSLQERDEVFDIDGRTETLRRHNVFDRVVPETAPICQIDKPAPEASAKGICGARTLKAERCRELS